MSRILAHLGRFRQVLSVNHHKLPLYSLSNGIRPSQFRPIYSSCKLKLESLDNLQNDVRRSLESGKDRFFARITGYLDNSEHDKLFREDLENLMGLAESDAEMDVIERFVESTRSSLKDMRTSGWGSVMMRLYFKNNMVDRAYNNVLAGDKFGTLFQEINAYKILMVMLYNAGRHNDVIEIYKLSRANLPIGKNSLLNGCKTERSLAIVAFAAYAKLNTPEAYNEANELYKLDESNPVYQVRALAFLSYMAVNQGQPTHALNLISSSPRSSLALRDIKTYALLGLERYEDCLFHLRRQVDSIRPGQTVIFRGTHERALECGTCAELRQLLLEIQESSLVSDKILEDIVFAPIIDHKQPAGPSAKRSFDSYQEPESRQQASRREYHHR